MSFKHIPITPELLEYVRSVSGPELECLPRLREETEKLPMGRMQISVEQGILMRMLAKLIGTRKAIEVGVFTGYSSISVAQALPADGKLIACDVSEEWTSIARRYWKEAGVDSKITLKLQPAVQTLDQLLAAGEAGTFDFGFIDADKENYDNYYERILQLLRPGGLLTIDNVLWSARVIDSQVNDIDTVALRALNLKLRNDARVEICMLPLGDGLTLARKK